jgi:hypothetical protein
MDTLDICAPDEFHDQWTVRGDLREIVNLEIDRRPGTGNSTNHVVATMLVVEGWLDDGLDPEWSCFFGYCADEAEAVRLRDDALRLTETLVA